VIGISFLAHVGSFVPAASARVGLTDRIFTRVASREAAALPQSAFMIDLSQVAAMLRLSTER
jgi:DNA mismatch repair protein MSH5